MNVDRADGGEVKSEGGGSEDDDDDVGFESRGDLKFGFGSVAEMI